MKNKVKLPVLIVMLALGILCVYGSATVTTYVTKTAIQQAVFETISDFKTETGQYPNWFVEWLNTIYIQEHTKEE